MNLKEYDVVALTEETQVKLFGSWVKSNEEGNFINYGTPDEPDAFVETLGVELAYPQQLQLVETDAFSFSPSAIAVVTMPTAQVLCL